MLEMKRGDLEPALVVTVEDAGGVANLNLVTSWRLIGMLNGVVVLDDAPDTAVVDAQNSSKAVLTRAWETAETATVGMMLGEAEATWPGGRKQTFPADGFFQVHFNADLG